jgi:hypothetical protein
MAFGLLLRGSGAVGGAGTLALAAVLACMLYIAAALTLAIILTLTRVLGNGGGSGLDAGRRGERAVGGERLSVEAGGGATEQTGKCSCKGERLRGIHHGETFRFGWAARMRWTVDGEGQ